MWAPAARRAVCRDLHSLSGRRPDRDADRCRCARQLSKGGYREPAGTEFGERRAVDDAAHGRYPLLGATSVQLLIET